ncbi:MULTISPECIES: Hsp20/alpha crystallin family protein [Arthrobacter]|uniref:Hsp20/alpha crystallin family protein n=1 Tax=Arthrobacter TaxID=1663 RepID=UPI000CE3F1C8|nr:MULTISPECIES: Hsp20/alpha crystallin family protein [Arthrobacter]MBO0895731.1 Hsp20/alpha crystallin family protein [Arthrobacter sunyaminii]
MVGRGDPLGEMEAGMAVDLYREDDHYILHADLPGLDPGSLTLDVDGQLLTLRGHRTLGDFSGAKWLVRDRRRGLIERHILLGDNVKAAGISAHYTCGVLNVLLPVDPDRPRRKIPVRYGSG